MDRGSWWATVHAVTKSRTRMSTHMHTQGDNLIPSTLRVCRTGGRSPVSLPQEQALQSLQFYGEETGPRVLRNPPPQGTLNRWL